MTTVYSIRKPATMPLTTGSLNVGGGNASSFGRQKQQQQHYSKPHTIQSGGMLTSYTPLPPSPPHKHKQQPQSNIGASSLDSTLSTNSRDVIVGDQWLVLSRIGEGSFGEVFEVQDIDTHRRYAIKREPLDVHSPQLQHESVMYDTLAGGRGIPQCQWYGEHDDFACIVIDLLGPSLRELSEAVSFFSLEIVVQLGCQMISILEDIHNRGIVYRDVKPDNFLFPAQFHLPEYGEMYEHLVSNNNNNSMTASHSPKPSCQDLFESWGMMNNSHNNKWSSSSSSVRVPKLSVVDFGLATWWRNPVTSKPYSQMKKRIKNKTGTARYASLNVHRGKIHTRRDDIESLGYLLLDLILGSLPWTGIQARNSKDGWDRMKELKEETVLNDLCVGLPRGFLRFIEYARSLRFSDEPDYDYLRQLMRDSLDHNSDMSRLVRPLGNTITHEEKQKCVPSTRYYHPNHQNYHQNQLQTKQQQQQTTSGNNNNTRRNSNKRRPSIKANHFSKPNNNNNNNGKSGISPVYNQEGVFMMDDLAQELPAVGEHQQQQQEQHRANGSGRRRRNSSRKLTISKGSNNFNHYNNNGNNNNNGRQQQQQQHPNSHHESPPRRNNKFNVPPSPPTASFQKFIENQNNYSNRRKRGVGWNTHKHHHHQQQHQYQITHHHYHINHHSHHPPPPDATIYVREPSWGEDKQDASWSHYQKWL